MTTYVVLQDWVLKLSLWLGNPDHSCEEGVVRLGVESEHVEGVAQQVQTLSKPVTPWLWVWYPHRCQNPALYLYLHDTWPKNRR